MARVAEAMDAVGVPYVVTGSMAAGFYVMPRMSGDIDFLINPQPSDKPFVAKILAEDFFADPDVIKEAFNDRSMFQVIDPNGHVKSDLIFWTPKFNPETVFQRAQTMRVEGTGVKVIAPEDLVIAKLIWAKESRSELQFRDVHSLLQFEEVDSEYVRRQAKVYGVGELLEEASSERYAT